MREILRNDSTFRKNNDTSPRLQRPNRTTQRVRPAILIAPIHQDIQTGIEISKKGDFLHRILTHKREVMAYNNHHHRNVYVRKVIRTEHIGLLRIWLKVMRHFDSDSSKKKKELPPQPDKPMSNSFPRSSL